MRKKLRVLLPIAVPLVAGVGVWQFAGIASQDSLPEYEIQTTPVVDRSAWAALASFTGIFAEHYESLPEMTTDTAAGLTTEAGEVFSPGIVVLATIDSVLPGRPLGDEPENAVETVNLVLQVSQVLAGDPAPEPLLNVEMLNPGGSGMTPAEVHAAISGEQGLFFLRNLGSEAEALGLPPAKQAADAPFWRKINSQGILLNDGGFVYAPMAAGVDENGIPLFPANLNGQPFEDIVGIVMLTAT